MRHRRGGFTLVELVVAMALLIVLLGMIMKGIGTFLQANTAQQQQTILEQNFRFATDTLSNDARQATHITTPSAVTGGLFLDESVTFELLNSAGGVDTVVYSMKTSTGGAMYYLARTVTAASGTSVQAVTEEIPQLFKVYFVRSGKKVFVIMVGRMTYYGRTRSVALSSLVYARNLGT